MRKKLGYEGLEIKRLMTGDCLCVVDGGAEESTKTYEPRYILSTGGDFQEAAGHTAKIHKLLVTDDFVFSTSNDRTAKD